MHSLQTLSPVNGKDALLPVIICQWNILIQVQPTDDVECFFSVLRDSLGKDFTVQNILYAWRHACLEFTK